MSYLCFQHFSYFFTFLKFNLLFFPLENGKTCSELPKVWKVLLWQTKVQSVPFFQFSHFKFLNFTPSPKPHPSDIKFKIKLVYHMNINVFISLMKYFLLILILNSYFVIIVFNTILWYLYLKYTQFWVYKIYTSFQQH